MRTLDVVAAALGTLWVYAKLVQAARGTDGDNCNTREPLLSPAKLYKTTRNSPEVLAPSHNSVRLTAV
jgi:hypothetical protein